MKCSFASLVVLWSSTTIAEGIVSPIENVWIEATEKEVVSIQNRSNEAVNVHVNEDGMVINGSTGIILECGGNKGFIFNFDDVPNSTFEVECQSRVVIGDFFLVELEEGERYE